MKKIEWALALFIAVGLFAIQAPSLFAVCANTDVECYTVNGTQVYKLDSSGNETVAGNSTISGNLAVTGTTAHTGATTQTGTQTISGKAVRTPTQFGGGLITTFAVIGSSVIPYTSNHLMVLSSASITFASLPTISTNITVGLSGVGGTGGVIDDGSYVTLTTTTPFRYTIKDNSALAGSLLILNGGANSTEVFTSTRPVSFQFNSGTGFWVQTSPYNGTF